MVGWGLGLLSGPPAWGSGGAGLGEAPSPPHMSPAHISAAPGTQRSSTESKLCPWHRPFSSFTPSLLFTITPIPVFVSVPMATALTAYTEL